MNHDRDRGFSLIGMLITVVCGIVLFVILMNSMNKAVTGQGSALRNTARSLEDQLLLSTLAQTMIASADDHNGRFVVPSELTGTNDVTLDTTANFFSAMVALRYVGRTEDLIAGNEYSGYVEPFEGYDYLAYSPGEGKYWDDRFQADLKRLSHVSYAHLPMFGERHERQWHPGMSSRFPILGNRGPRNGIDDAGSATVGRNGIWGGHMVFGDGHVEFLQEFTTGLTYEGPDGMQPDNLFAMEEGPDGRDAIIAFTRTMFDDGPELQWD
jgi:hypothetical protein